MEKEIRAAVIASANPWKKGFGRATDQNWRFEFSKRSGDCDGYPWKRWFGRTTDHNSRFEFSKRSSDCDGYPMEKGFRKDARL
jgi:hypothetical protein